MAGSAPGGVALSCPGDTSDTGAFRLSWEAPEGAEVRLVERAAGEEGSASTIYQGVQRASTITGRPAGSYHYRAGLVQGGEVAAWSEACTVQVAPPSALMAAGFFGAGLLVCLATVLLVLRGHRAHRRGVIG